MKVELANMVIKKAFSEHDPNKCAVACSFGKDSVVVLDLVRRIHPDILVEFTNTGVEFPETIQFKKKLVKDWRLNILEAKSKDWTFWTLIDKYGWPPLRFDGKNGTRNIKCCYYLKELPAFKVLKERGIELIFTGITAHESRNRMMLERRCGDYYFAKTQGFWKCHPIMSWTPEEVWQYIREKKVPYNPFYDRFPKQRVGCLPCTGHIGWEKKMAAAFPKMYRKIQKMKGQGLIDDIGGP
jgi:3'-phosphoadenosine 5'-phosphosulfate sulfotransferase (PAPS reductase)/FAD synthetase